jgi:hypothetical protein
MLNAQRRFRPIPQVFYYSISEKHISLSFGLELDVITISLEPGPNFHSLSDKFFETLKVFGFDKVAKNHFSFQTIFKSPSTVMQKIGNYCREAEMSLAFHLLNYSDLSLAYNKESESVSILDKFLTIVLPNRTLLNFSCFDAIESTIEYDMNSLKVSWVMTVSRTKP